MVIDAQEATRLVIMVAQTSPEDLPQCPEFAWTAPLTPRQRQKLHDEAVDALADHPDDPPDDQLNAKLTGALASDLRVAKLLMGRPEFAASVLPEWNISDFWYFGEEWQAGEREAAAERAAGRFVRYDSDEEFLASFEEIDAQLAAHHAHLR